ncbi:trypsin alpha-4 [Drosophila eugracilis]|uniref:trypsin alpha-4 n=1 Tax=Drosophila eugracilis TaxID=29029 RepID=UPI001BDA99E2|nr:trypsin alpha-4 [Drosophila eugracilis]
MLLKVILIAISIFPILSDSLLDELPITIGQVPWQASIQINGKHHCGGVIYSENIILTIAECVRKANIKTISVRVGSSLKNIGGIVVNVKQMRMQVTGLRPSDVAILQLQSSLKMGLNVQPIPLATSVPAPGTKATVSGWGQLSSLTPPSEILLRVNLRIQQQFMCTARNALKGRLIILDEICAAPWGIIPLACQGFVGGPLVCGNQLVGIVSWNNVCDFLNTPSVYANIPLLKIWIDSTASLLNVFKLG